MASWRDTASQQAQDDLDDLLGPALECARQQLDKHGEFYPYAVVLDGEGEQEMVAVDLQQRPEPSAVITTLIALLRARRDELRAVGVVAHARI